MRRNRKFLALAVLIAVPFVARSLILSVYHPDPPEPDTSHATGEPINFVTKAVKDAAAQAALDHKVLVMDAMATWCGPCKQMERESWSSPAVESWIKANAVFIKVDVDQDEDTSERLGIEAMPTVVVFKDGKEQKRSVGFLDAGELLEWLKSG